MFLEEQRLCGSSPPAGAQCLRFPLLLPQKEWCAAGLDSGSAALQPRAPCWPLPCTPPSSGPEGSPAEPNGMGCPWGSWEEKAMKARTGRRERSETAGCRGNVSGHRLNLNYGSPMGAGSGKKGPGHQSCLQFAHTEAGRKCR